MADVLPIDTASPALTHLPATIPLTPAHVREHEGWILDIHLDDCEDDACAGCEPQHLAQQAAARQARAEEHLAACAAEAGMTPDEYRKQGLLAELHHQVDDPAVPYSPYLTAGGQS